MAGLELTVLTTMVNAIVSARIAAMDLLLTTATVVLKTPYVTTTQRILSTRNVSVRNGGLVMTVASIVDPVPLLATDVLDQTPISAKTALRMPTTKLMEHADVVMNGWDLTVHTNVQIAMRHVTSV